MRQSATELSEKQELALVLLLAGKSDAEAAGELGIDRSTVWRWRKTDSVFEAELNARRQSLWASYSDRLRILVPGALAVLERALESSDPIDSWRIALSILKAAGLADIGAPVGHIDAEEIDRVRRAKRTQDTALEKIMDMDELLAGL